MTDSTATLPAPIRSPAEARAPTNGAGVVYLSPPTSCQMANEWFQFAVDDHFWFQWRLAAILKVLKARAVAEPALEVGCGNAASRNQLERACACRIDGCDLNSVPLEQARSGRGALYCYDVHDRRPEWRDHFATVMLLDTLEHIPEPVPFLASVAHHMRRDGALLITVPAQQWLYSRYDEVDGHVKRYSLARLRDELTSANLVLERHAYWGLSLIPIIMLRKLVMRFCAPEKAIAVGFQPASQLVDHVLRAFMRIERACGTRMPVGVSLVALARRQEVART